MDVRPIERTRDIFARDSINDDKRLLVIIFIACCIVYDSLLLIVSFDIHKGLHTGA